MTVIYVDTLFLLNAIIDYLLLLGAARLAGERLQRLRFALGGALGGAYAVAIFLPGLNFLNALPCRAAAAALMALAAYGGSRRLLRQTLIFLALSCALGGGVLAVGLLGRQGLTLSEGVFYSGMDLKIVLLSAAGCYVALTLLFKGAVKHSSFTGEILPARLVLDGRQAQLNVLADTGNTLTDPVSGAAVLVAEGEFLHTLFPPERRPTPEDMKDPAQGLLRLGTQGWKGRFRLLPYRAVGVEQGLLLAVKADEVWVGGTRRDLLVALSPTPLSDGGAYRGLVGAN